MKKNILQISKFDKLLEEICLISKCKEGLYSNAKLGIIDDVGTALNNLNKKELALKKQFVLRYHENKISEITLKRGGTAWQTNCRYGNNPKPRFVKEEDLYDYLYHVYADIETRQNLPDDYSFQTIFNIALQVKKETEAPKDTTISNYNSQYTRFITKELGAKDIRKITTAELKKYIQDTITEQKLTKKALYKLKGVFNLVFNYACDPEQGYISVNPVPKNNKPFIKRCVAVSTKPEDKAFQPEELETIRTTLWRRIIKAKYSINSFAILFSIETGVREGEIPAIKWVDVDFENRRIHIHAQQNIAKDKNAEEVKSSPYVTTSKTGKTIYYYNPSTKNEKGESKDGRTIPLTKEVEKILRALQAKQQALSIQSDWVFCDMKGEWISTISYYSALYRLTKDKLGCGRTNNHAFRIAYNSYVLIPAGLEVTERAKILGHSVTTNERFYTFSKSDEYLYEIRDKLDAFNDLHRPEDPCHPVSPSTIPFKPKRKSPRTANS